MRKLSYIGICLLSLWFMASFARASTYEKGLEAFELGEYSKAYKALSKAEKKAKANEDKAKIVALMAASTLKSGKADKAKKLFAKALKLDPEVQLESIVAKDKKVKKMFASVQEDSGGGEGDEADSDGGKGNKSKKDSNKSVSGITYILPFGINQYVQGKTIPAIIFGVGQAGGIGLFLYFKSEADKADLLAKDAITAAMAAGKTTDPSFLTYLDENEGFVKSSRQQSTIGLALFGASYAVSVLDAAFGFFGSKKNSSASMLPTSDPLTGLDTSLEARASSAWTYDLIVLPTPTPSKYPLLGLSLKTSF